jgi:hypothetical protein
MLMGRVDAGKSLVIAVRSFIVLLWLSNEASAGKSHRTLA